MQKKIKITVLTMLLFVSCAFCADDYTIKTLNSGQKVIVKQVTQNPIVTIDTWIKTGSIDETPETSGLAHFLEHLFFKGTQKYKTGEYDRILEGKGAITNAATSKDFTHYYVTIPSKYFELALSLHSDMLQNPLVPRKELEKERLVVLEEISRSNDSAQSVMSNQLFDMLYKDFNHPYMRAILGDNKNIENVTREQILDFYNKNYTKNNFTTIIVGDVAPDFAIKKVEEYFTNDKKEIKNAKKYPKISKIDKKLRKVTEKDNIETGYLTLCFRTIKAKNVHDAYALDVLATIFGNGESSRLNQALKEQKELVYSINASSSTFYDDGLFLIGATFDPKKLNIVENSIADEINSLKNGEITADELQKAKNLITTQVYYSRESISNIANEMGYFATVFNSLNVYDDYIKNVQSVSAKDVLNVAKKYLDTEKSATSIVIPKGTKFEEKKAENANYEAKILEKNGKITRYKLSNGATLIIEKNNTNKIVAYNIRMIGGGYLEKIPTVSNLSAMTLLSGTKNYTNKEFKKTLDENAIDLNASSGADSFTISMQTTKNKTDIALQLLSEVLNSPTFPQNEIDKAKKLKLASIKAMRDNPMSENMDEFKALAYQNSIYGYNSKTVEKNIEKITREDVKDYYKTVLNPKNIVISICGDVDEKEMVNYFSKNLASYDSQKFDIRLNNKNQFKPSANIEKTITKRGIQTSWIFIGYKTCPIFNAKDMATLRVINAILGEGMSSRLFTNLRDNKGLAYAIGSTLNQNFNDGAILAYIGTNPKNVEIAKNDILKEFATFKTEFVSQKELAEAKDKILGNLLISLETNADMASINGHYGALGYSINRLDEYKKLIENVTQSDVLAVANKYFSAPYIMSVIRP